MKMLHLVIETFLLQYKALDKLKQLLLLSTEVYQFSINPDESYCFYKVSSSLSVVVFFVYPYPPTTHDSEQIPFSDALDLVQLRQVVVKKVVSTRGLID